MPSPGLSLAFLFTLCFTLATFLQPWFQDWSGSRSQQAGVLATVMGDSRRLFANHFLVKADVYFHRGYYPSIFDQAKEAHSLHIAEDAGAVAEKNEEGTDYLGQPKDWIDRFGRNFYPSRHSHLEHDNTPGKSTGPEREILPWLKLSASLDPQKVESYTVAAYWLRQMNNYEEAERFLREGLRANPNSYEILFELGRVYAEGRKDPKMARNLWELALRRWNEQEANKPEPNNFMLLQICTYLVQLELKEGNSAKAVSYLEIMKKVSPNPDAVQKRIEEIKQGKN